MEIAVIVLILMILLNGFFAGSEMALVSLNETKVRRAANRGDKTAVKIYNLISEPSRFLSTIQIGVTLSGFLASAFAADFFAAPVASALSSIGVPLTLSALETLSVVVITIILSYFTLVFGELVPKQIALQKAEPISKLIAAPLNLMFKLSLPIVKLLSVSTNAVVRLLGVDPHANSDQTSEEDIRMMIDAGRETGNIRHSEVLMIENVFEFNDKKVTQIGTHRTDIEAIEAGSSLDEVIDLVDTHSYARFPVYEGDIDNIVGILNVRDLISLIKGSSGTAAFSLEKYCRKAYFVHQNQTIDVIFRRMQQENIHVAVILDEFGGTEGIITIEDIIEEIVGDILSEHNDNSEEDEFVKLSNNKFLVSGVIQLVDLETNLNTELPKDDNETLNGFLIDELGDFPKYGDQPAVEYKNLYFKVIEVGENRIEKVMITVRENEKEG